MTYVTIYNIYISWMMKVIQKKALILLHRNGYQTVKIRIYLFGNSEEELEHAL